MRPSFVPGTFHGLQDCEIALFEAHLPSIAGRGVELGCCDGYSTAIILANSGLFLTSIDPMIQTEPMGNNVPSVDRLKTNIILWQDRHQLIVDMSWNVVQNWKEPLDFLYIDGDHEKASMDFDQWTPLLKSGGLLAMHDYGSWPEPTRIVNERLLPSPEWHLVDKAGWLVLFKKL